MNTYASRQAGLACLPALLLVLALAACTEPAPPASPNAMPTQTPLSTPVHTETPSLTPRPTPPPVQIPRKEAAYRPAWREGDLRALDPWGDAGGDSQDLVAVYSRQEGSLLRFRVDVLDLRAGTVPDLYLALDFADGGARALEPGGVEITDLAWDLLVKVS